MSIMKTIDQNEIKSYATYVWVYGIGVYVHIYNATYLHFYSLLCIFYVFVFVTIDLLLLFLPVIYKLILNTINYVMHYYQYDGIIYYKWYYTILYYIYYSVYYIYILYYIHTTLHTINNPVYVIMTYYYKQSSYDYTTHISTVIYSSCALVVCELGNVKVEHWV